MTPRWRADPGTGPLAGIRVLDLSRILAGPYSTMQLADLGASVVKVESPAGDETRRWGPPFLDDGTATYYHAINRGKRSITLDLGRAEDVGIVRALAGEADILIENFLPGRLAGFGLDLETLRATNPALVTCTISTFGSGNAYSSLPGYDFLVQAMGGLMSVTGSQDSGPSRVGVAVSDLAAGLYVVQGVLAALVRRSVVGHGAHVEIALIDAVLSLLVPHAMTWLLGGQRPGLHGNAHPNVAPFDLFDTADGPLALAAGTDRQFHRLAVALGDSRLIEERFATNGGRVQHLPELRAILAEHFRSAPRVEWIGLLRGVGVPVAPLNTVAEAFEDPVVRSRMITTADGVPQLRSPVRIDGDPLQLFLAAPALGQHTAQVSEWFAVAPDPVPATPGVSK